MLSFRIFCQFPPSGISGTPGDGTEDGTGQGTGRDRGRDRGRDGTGDGTGQGAGGVDGVRTPE